MKLFIALTALLALAAPVSAGIYVNGMPRGESCIAGLAETSPGVYALDWLDSFGLTTIEVNEDTLKYIKETESRIGRSLSC